MLDSLFIGPAWQQIWWGNTVQDYTVALVVLVVFWSAFWLLQKLVLSRLRRVAERTATDIDDTVLKIVDEIKPSFYLVLAVWGSVRTLALSDGVARVVNTLLMLVLAYQVVMSLQILIDYLVKRWLAKGKEEEMSKEQERQTESALGIINLLAKFVLWSVGLLFVLSNLGINVTSLVASLGIGGIAIALAAQNILGDLFSSLAIYLDKPFAIGDMIAVGDVRGTVQHIGIKTTRIKTLTGEEVILPNKELTNSQVQNFRKMSERRVIFELGVVYDTEASALTQIPQMLKNLIDKTDNCRFDRAHFKTFGDSALIFEVVYYVTAREFAIHVKAQQAINVAIKESFDAAGLEFAYPTQTQYVHTVSH